MFKQAENKQEKSVFTTPGGRRITLAEAEAFAPRGPWGTEEISAAAFFGLRTPGGRPFASLLPIEPTPDPLRPRPEEAPVKLRETLAAAEQGFSEVKVRYHAAIEARAVAEDEVQMAVQAGDKKRYNAALAVRERLVEELRDADVALAAPRVAYARAQEHMYTWLRLEENHRRSQAAK